MNVPKIVKLIKENPIAVLSDPLSTLNKFTLDEIQEAITYFSLQTKEKLVYSICTKFVNTKFPLVNSWLKDKQLSEYSNNRFWPFWYASDIKDNENMSLDYVSKYLQNIWSILLKSETGSLKIKNSFEIDQFQIFKCVINMPLNVSDFVLIFDKNGKGFYSQNCRIKISDEFARYRFIEMINPDIDSPLSALLKDNKITKKVVVIFDRHIGENLTLFPTYIDHLTRLKNVDITLDISRCEFFRSFTDEYLKKITGLKCEISREVLDYNDFDLIIDPYDMALDNFSKKIHETSSMESFYNALELYKSHLFKKSRNIIEIHMSTLKKWGICTDQKTPEFLRFNFTQEERQNIRNNLHKDLLKEEHKNKKIVSIFPFGLTDDRKYPPQALKSIIKDLKEKDFFVVIAGSAIDAPDIMNSIPFEDSNDLVIPWIHQSPKKIIELMLASNTVVCMDSGPLHIARALRINPIAIYTDKIKNEIYLFPWFVDDKTAICLEPLDDNHHVLPEQILNAI